MSSTVDEQHVHVILITILSGRGFPPPVLSTTPSTLQLACNFLSHTLQTPLIVLGSADNPAPFQPAELCWELSQRTLKHARSQRLPLKLVVVLDGARLGYILVDLREVGSGGKVLERWERVRDVPGVGDWRPEVRLRVWCGLKAELARKDREDEDDVVVCRGGEVLMAQHQNATKQHYPAPTNGTRLRFNGGGARLNHRNADPFVSDSDTTASDAPQKRPKTSGPVYSERAQYPGNESPLTSTQELQIQIQSLRSSLAQIERARDHYRGLWRKSEREVDALRRRERERLEEDVLRATERLNQVQIAEGSGSVFPATLSNDATLKR